MWRKPLQIKSLQSALKRGEKGINSAGTNSELTLKELSESRSQNSRNASGEHKEIQPVTSVLWRRNLGQ